MIIILILLLAKHYLCDIKLQSAEMSNGKRLSGWPGAKHLARHSGIHGVFTFVVVALYGLITVEFYIILISPLIGLLDLVLHYLIDKLKVILEKRFSVQYKSREWATLLILDQGLHFLSYILYIVILT